MRILCKKTNAYFTQKYVGDDASSDIRLCFSIGYKPLWLRHGSSVRQRILTYANFTVRVLYVFYRRE